jgi:2'-5' RNA ligase
MIRLFVGLELPEAVRERLHGLAGGVPGARWIDPENMHMTLRFIGNVNDDVVADIDEALARVRAPAFYLAIAGLGEFSRGRHPAMIWAGVTPAPPLMDLQRRIEAAVVKAGYPPEGRRFSPHVTLARLKNGTPGRVRDFIAAHNLLRIDPFPVARFTLFSSHLGRKGASYRPEADYPLAITQGAQP